MPHIIRLRGLWQHLPLGQGEQTQGGSPRISGEPPPPAGTFRAPGNWRELLGDDFRGLVRLTRVFHCPTGLDASSRVWITFCEMPSAIPGIVLNGCPCGEA